jgi:hypothetical protein
LSEKDYSSSRRIRLRSGREAPTSERLESLRIQFIENDQGPSPQSRAAEYQVLNSHPPPPAKLKPPSHQPGIHGQQASANQQFLSQLQDPAPPSPTRSPTRVMQTDTQRSGDSIEPFDSARTLGEQDGLLSRLSDLPPAFPAQRSYTEGHRSILNRPTANQKTLPQPRNLFQSHPSILSNLGLFLSRGTYVYRRAYLIAESKRPRMGQILQYVYYRDIYSRSRAMLTRLLASGEKRHLI